jgi:hypothetical protein
MPDYDGESLMDRGQYRGRRLDHIPMEYLEHIAAQPWMGYYPALKARILRHLETRRHLDEEKPPEEEP